VRFMMADMPEWEPRHPSGGGGNPAYTALAQGAPTRMDYSNPVLGTVMRRKQTEKEVEALENRIKRLELEEAKAKKGVQLARERNQHMVQAHERNKKMAEERRQHELARRAEMEARREAVNRQKAEQRVKLQRAFVGMYNEKLGEARQLREEQQQVLHEAAKVRDRDRTRNAGRHAAIRNRRKELSERFEQQRIAHQEYLMRDFINLVQAELEQKELIEQDIQRLDQIEAEHMERIRQLQEEQRAAYDRLEEALAS